MSQKEWSLQLGIHRGTLMSRDTERGTHDFDTYEEVEACAKKAAMDYARMGCFIWIATANNNRTGERRNNVGGLERDYSR